MRKRWWLLIGVAMVASIGGASWLIVDYYFPVPSSLVGEWEIESKREEAGYGKLPLMISRDGTAVAMYSRTEYRFRCRVRGDRVMIQAIPDGEPITMAIEIGADRFRIWDPAEECPERNEMVFRRTAGPQACRSSRTRPDSTYKTDFRRIRLAASSLRCE